MENASKALIIAGAILLSILIISLGIMIFNQASGVVNNNAMSEVEISSFNQKFTQFEGKNIKGSQVNSLLNQIVQSNVANQDDSSKQVTIDVTASNWSTTEKPAKNAPKNSVSKALTGKTYSVLCVLNEQSGLVTTVKIGDGGKDLSQEEP